MDRFSEAYDAAKKALQTALAGNYEKMRGEMSALLSAGGPNAGKKGALDKLRGLIEIDGTVAFVSGSGTKTDGEATAITDAAGTGAGKGKRAATLKMLRHFYHGQTAGGAAIWVYSPPKVYTKWIYDEITADSDTAIKSVLKKDPTEVYSEEDRKVMVQAIQAANKIACDAVVKLDAKSTATVDLIKQYFTDPTSAAGDVDTAITTLKKGYQKISTGLCSSSLVISDEPIDRNGGGWKDWAFIYPSEAMKVIYLQGAWVSKANEVTPSNQSPLYRCARTVLHEMSHKECSTEDVVYGPKGLKPAGSTDLTGAYALHNADSWAYFAVDVVGLLTGPDAANATKPCTGIRQVPNKSLNV